MCNLVFISLLINFFQGTLCTGQEVSKWLPFLSGFLSKGDEKPRSVKYHGSSHLPALTNKFLSEYISFASKLQTISDLNLYNFF